MTIWQYIFIVIIFGELIIDATIWIVFIALVLAVVIVVIANKASGNAMKRASKMITDGKISSMKDFKYTCEQLECTRKDLLSADRQDAKDLLEKLWKLKEVNDARNEPK